MDSKPCAVQLPGQPMDCCISSTAPVLASGLVDGQILLHRYEPPQPADPEGGDACSTSYSSSQVFARSSKKGASCRAVSFSADGQLLLAGFETGTILQLDAGSGKVLARMTKAHSAGINRLLCLSTAAGQAGPPLLAAGDDSGGLRVWDLRSQAAVYQYSKHTDYIAGLAQRSSGSKQQQDALLAVSGDGTLSVHDLRGGKLVARSETDADDELLSVAVCKHGKKVVCGSQSGVLALWSWGYWNDCSDRFPGHPESVDALVKFDEDTLITGSSDGLLRVLNILPNKLIGVLGAHADDMPVERLALSQDRAVLASMSHDSCVKLWDLSVLQDDSGAEGDSSSEWEEAGSEEAADAQAQQQDGAPAAAAAQQGQTGRGNSAAAAAAAGSDDSDSDSDSDEPQSGSKKRKKREKTAVRKGAGKPKSGGNFFADLL